MKKFSSLFIAIFILLSTLGCNKKSASLNPANPITLNMWHVYGEQADSPMHRYVEEFNSTVGKQKGVIINVTLLSNAQKIGGQLLSAQKNVPGVPSMPDATPPTPRNSVKIIFFTGTTCFRIKNSRNSFLRF